MEPILSVAAMRQSDAAEIAAGTDSKQLMYRAGVGIFQSTTWQGKVAIVCGSGNNAGDGYVLALLLQESSIDCRIIQTTDRTSTDGAYYLEKCRTAGIPITQEMAFAQTDCIVDCLLGTGFAGQLRPNLRQVVEQINAASARIISVDINSGMHGDTGAGSCVKSDLTVSIGSLQYGHLVGLAEGKIGRLCNVDIGIPCVGEFLWLASPGETPIPTASPLPAELIQTLDAAGIPKGDNAARLQTYVAPHYDRIAWRRYPGLPYYSTGAPSRMNSSCWMPISPCRV